MEEEINNPHAPGTVFTGERLKANRPDVYQGIVSMLGQGVGVREISRRLRVHHRTVQAVSMREGQTIDTMRRELGARALGIAGLAMEALEERIVAGSVKPGELAMTVGILVDKGQVLTGGVTGRTERVERVAVAQELDAMLVEVETLSDTGLSGDGIFTNSGPVAALPGGDSDCESDVLPSAPMVTKESATGFATGEGALDGDGSGFAQGAGGVCKSAGGVENHTDT
jgi:hypothetical protein